jgi:hypothetical protein
MKHFSTNTDLAEHDTRRTAKKNMFVSDILDEHI